MAGLKTAVIDHRTVRRPPHAASRLPPGLRALDAAVVTYRKNHNTLLRPTYQSAS